MLIILLVGASSLFAQSNAPLFSGTDMQTGEQISLEALRGKVVFLDFWASWCPPCLVSLPAYEQMNKAIDSNGFVMLAINVDEDIAEGMEFLKDAGVTYSVMADPNGEIGIPFGIRSLPVAYLIDRQGRIVERYRGFEPGDEREIQQRIELLLSSNQ